MSVWPVGISILSIAQPVSPGYTHSTATSNRCLVVNTDLWYLDVCVCVCVCVFVSVYVVYQCVCVCVCVCVCCVIDLYAHAYVHAAHQPPWSSCHHSTTDTGADSFYYLLLVPVLVEDTSTSRR